MRNGELPPTNKAPSPAIPMLVIVSGASNTERPPVPAALSCQEILKSRTGLRTHSCFSSSVNKEQQKRKWWNAMIRAGHDHKCKGRILSLTISETHEPIKYVE